MLDVSGKRNCHDGCFRRWATVLVFRITLPPVPWIGWICPISLHCAEKRHPERHPDRAGPFTWENATTGRSIGARRATSHPKMHVCGHFLYCSGGADLMSDSSAHGGLDARLGATLVSRTDAIVPNDLHHVGEESSSPRKAHSGRTRNQPLPGSTPGDGRPNLRGIRTPTIRRREDRRPTGRRCRGVQITTTSRVMSGGAGCPVARCGPRGADSHAWRRRSGERAL